jgi:hypothetical protein
MEGDGSRCAVVMVIVTGMVMGRGHGHDSTFMGDGRGNSLTAVHILLLMVQGALPAAQTQHTSSTKQYSAPAAGGAGVMGPRCYCFVRA